MAFLKGSILFTGKLGELVAYERNGKMVLQGKGGPSAAQFKHAKSMARTRENAAEFKHATQLGGQIRRGLGEYSRYACDTYMHSRMNGLLRKLLKEDSVNKRGERRVPATSFDGLKALVTSEASREVGTYLDGCKWREAGGQAICTFPAPDADLFYRKADAYQCWIALQVVELTGAYGRTYMVRSDVVNLGEGVEANLSQVIPPILPGEGITYVRGLQTFKDGLKLADKRMNGMVFGR